MNRAVVRLRRVVPSDADLLYTWINDRELVQFNAPFREISRRDHDAWFAAVLSTVGPNVFFMFETLADGRTIGSCQLTNVQPIHRNALLQIRIGVREDWGRGYGTDAVRQLVSWGFREMGLHRIGLQVFATNTRAQAAYLKAGFHHEGVSREAVCIDGKFIDVANMAILNV